MKALKIILVIVVLLVAVLAIGGYFLFNNLGGFIKYAVETSGPKLTQTEVTLRDADVDLASGTVTLQGFRIGNPQGFDADYLFNLEQLRLAIDTNTLQNEVIVVKTLTVDGIEVQVEQKGRQINLWQLKKNLPPGADSGERAAPEEAPSGKQQKFMIEELRFAEGSMRFISDKFGERGVKLPTLTVDNLGTRSEGLTAEQLGAEILSHLADNAKRAAEGELGAELKRSVEATLQQKKQALSDELSDKLQGDEGLQKAREKLKNLF